MELALDSGADPNGRGMLGKTALQMAAILGDEKLDIIDLLVARGADLNAAAWYGDTPLMTAAMMGKAGAVKRLLELGADPSTKKQFGESALGSARTGTNDPEVIRLLESALGKQP